MAFYSASKPTADNQGRVELIVDTDAGCVVLYGDQPGTTMAYHFSTLDWINAQVAIALDLDSVGVDFHEQHG